MVLTEIAVSQTNWEGGIYELTMAFPEEYPTRPPKCTPTPRAVTVTSSGNSPDMTSSRQIHSSPFPPERISFRNRVSVHS